MIKFILIIIWFQKFRCFFSSTYFLVSCSRISSTALLTILLFSCFLLNVFLGIGLLPWYLVGLPLTWLEPKYFRNLHSSEECLEPWIRQVSILPTGDIDIVFCDCKRYHSSQSESVTRWLLLSFASCDQHSWIIP